MDIVIEVAERLKEAYPQSYLQMGDPDESLPEILRACAVDSSIVEGDFSQRPDEELARAM